MFMLSNIGALYRQTEDCFQSRRMRVPGIFLPKKKRRRVSAHWNLSVVSKTLVKFRKLKSAQTLIVSHRRTPINSLLMRVGPWKMHELR